MIFLPRIARINLPHLCSRKKTEKLNEFYLDYRLKMCIVVLPLARMAEA